MNSVLRIALTYFYMLPLQRWLNIAGLLLLSCGALMAFLGLPVNGARAVFTLCTFGVTLILLVPSFGGGLAMRLASRPSIVHLRPHGRFKVLLGSTLAMTLVALIAVIPAATTQWFIATSGHGPGSRYPQALETLAFFWPVAAVGWILIFAASRTLLLALAFPLIPMGALQLPVLLQRFPAFRPHNLVAIGASAWLIFGFWYLLGKGAKPAAAPNGAFANPGSGPVQYQWLVGARNEESGENTPARAMACYLLGTSSIRVFVFTGLWLTAIFLGMALLIPSSKPQGGLLLFMLPFLGVNSAIMGFSAARRARLLWLRNGLHRNELFRLTERIALRGPMTTWGIVGGAITVFMLVTQPGSAQTVLTFVAAQCLFAVCLFYTGMALVRNWDASDVALSLGILLLMIIQMIYAHPLGGIPPLQPLITLLVAAVLLLPVRWYAKWRWAGLDWRLIRPPQLDWRRR